MMIVIILHGVLKKKFGLSIAGLRQRFKAPASDFLYLYNQAVGKNHEIKNNKKI